MDASAFRKLSVAELSHFLTEKGIPATFCKAFEENFVNGRAFLRLSQMDVKKMVPPIGLAKKICALIPVDPVPSLTPDLKAKLEAMSVDEIGDYLQEALDVPLQYCEVFEDNYVDGQVLFQLTEEDLLAMIQPIGVVKNVMSLILGDQNKDFENPPTSPIPVVGLVRTSPSQSSVTDTASVPSSAGSSVSLIPEHWRPEVEECLKQQCLTPKARDGITRTLVNVLFSRVPKPSRVDCDAIARKLILKYPCAKDDLGCGYQSWSDKLIERVRNVIKYDNKKARSAGRDPPSSPKRYKKATTLVRRYPVSSYNLSDPATAERHRKGISDELEKARPRDAMLLPLLRGTFGERRMFVMNTATCLADVLKEHPALTRTAVMDQELGLILGKSDAKQMFVSEWSTKFVPAIISYGEKLGKTAITDIIKAMKTSDDASRQVTALKVLARSFAYRRIKDNLPFLYEEYDETMTIENVKKLSKYTQPRIAAFITEGRRQYFVVAEQRVLCEVPSLQDALFYTFASYYIFNLAYAKETEKILFFFQDYIIQHPDSVGRTSTYLSTASDIKRNI